MQIAGSTAFITGGASGLGAATARHLASLGAQVGVLDRDGERGAAIASEIGGVFTECDVSSAESLEAAFAHLVEQLGPPRITVACAGIGAGKKVIGRNGPHSLDEFERIVNINLIGVFNIVRLAAWAMHDLEPIGADGERGVIVTTASIAATDGVDGGVSYSASKGGVLGMTLPLARDLAPWGIRVVSISPGSFDTPLVEGMPDEYAQQMAATTPFPPRFGQATEYAQLCAHIISNTMLNGSDMRIDGGMRMAPSRLR